MMSPFEAALGSKIERADLLVRQHFAQRYGRRRYSGRMHRVWRRKGWRGVIARPGLWLASRAQTLFYETGIDVPFALEHVVRPGANGDSTMSWVRTFRFPNRIRKFPAEMQYDHVRGTIVDWLGTTSGLEVELHPRVEGGAMVIESGRQWKVWGTHRREIPLILRGKARVREWQNSENTLGIRVTIENRILGPFFGYEGTFSEVRDEIERGRRHDT